MEAAKLSPESLFDLVTISVLLDAGAGADWKFQFQGKTFVRSEGLGVASYAMLADGLFGRDADSGIGCVHAKHLRTLTTASLATGMQVSKLNPLLGLENRRELLSRLGERLTELNYTKPSDVLHACIKGKTEIDLSVFWQEMFKFIVPVFPKKDIHFHRGTNTQVPFHKLVQWLMYSYVEVLERNFHLTVLNKDLQTGLPEYRNGGLFVDLGVLIPKISVDPKQPFPVSSDFVIEWRACTVVLLDLLREKHFPHLPLACLLEGGTWAAGRVAAKDRRPETGDSPIPVLLDGTVF
jgi:hypothetical protein